MMRVMSNAGRTNKGSAWAYLKQALVDALGSEAADKILDGYYTRMHEEYKDRRRLNAAAELEVLRQQVKQAGLPVSEVRKLERKIQARERLLAG